MSEPIPYVEEVEHLTKVFLEAEQRLVNIISYKQQRDQVIYSQLSELDRVQEILAELLKHSSEYVPIIVDRQYKSGIYHSSGYENARALTGIEHKLVNRLVQNLLGEIVESTFTLNDYLTRSLKDSLIIGQREAGIYRTELLNSLSLKEAAGLSSADAQKDLINRLKSKGLVAFTDKSGRNWSLSNYANMAIRTTARQATNLGALFSDLNHDLYQISSHGSTCPICAPLEGRVYSRSGSSKNYPALALAFGKVDKAAPTSLENSWLNIHPNCLHVMVKFTEQGKSDEELKKIQEFSSFESNPISIDPRSRKQIEQYRNKEKGRAKLLNDINQFNKYKLVLGNNIPKTFKTFQKHKLANDQEYKYWQMLFRKTNKQLKAIT